MAQPRMRQHLSIHIQRDTQLMRVMVIEAAANGYVVRRRAGDDMTASVCTDLSEVMEKVRAYFLAPDDSDSSSPSFGMIPALKLEIGALEPKPKEYRTPLPTESIAPVTQADVKTVRMSETEVHRMADEDEDPFAG